MGDDIMSIIFMTIGGLGIFLLGMKYLSEGMQAIAGKRLRALIGAVTSNRFVACGVGTFITCVIQSSSITTVTVVGLVNASIMTLHQAIGVILGANIGTTITGWIFALKVSKYGLPMLGLAAFFYLFTKRDKLRYTAMALMGLGMVFYGLEMMKDGFEPLRNMPRFIEWFSKFNTSDYWGVMKCCLAGAILTAIIQSSSATLGITMSLAFTGVIRFDTAAALVLGENIGTTITAFLASLGACTNAKRAAYAHVLINVIGVFWITLIFHLYMQGIRYALLQFGVDPYVSSLENGATVYPMAMKGIALTHTGFNVINAFIFLPLLPLLARLLIKLAPDKGFKEEPHLSYLDVRMLDTPAIGIQQSANEVQRMGRGIDEMMQKLRITLPLEAPDEVVEKRVFQLEENLDTIQREIVEFLGKMLAGNVPHEVMDRGRGQIRMADELETISDYVCSVLKLRIRLRKNGLEMSEVGVSGLFDLHDHVFAFLRIINSAIAKEDSTILANARTDGAAITRLFKQIRSEHLTRVEAGLVSPLKSLIYMDMLTAYRRIKDHGVNIAEVLSGDK